jgi:hypothetical protein
MNKITIIWQLWVCTYQKRSHQVPSNTFVTETYWLADGSLMYLILGYCFVFGPYYATLLLVIDIIRRRFSGYSVISESYVQASFQDVFYVSIHQKTHFHLWKLCKKWFNSYILHRISIEIPWCWYSYKVYHSLFGQ